MGPKDDVKYLSGKIVVPKERERERERGGGGGHLVQSHHGRHKFYLYDLDINLYKM